MRHCWATSASKALRPFARLSAKGACRQLPGCSTERPFQESARGIRLGRSAPAMCIHQFPIRPWVSTVPRASLDQIHQLQRREFPFRAAYWGRRPDGTGTLKKPSLGIDAIRRCGYRCVQNIPAKSSLRASPSESRLPCTESNIRRPNTAQSETAAHQAHGSGTIRFCNAELHSHQNVDA